MPRAVHARRDSRAVDAGRRGPAAGCGNAGHGRDPDAPARSGAPARGRQGRLGAAALRTGVDHPEHHPPGTGAHGAVQGTGGAVAPGNNGAVAAVPMLRDALCAPQHEAFVSIASS